MSQKVQPQPHVNTMTSQLAQLPVELVEMVASHLHETPHLSAFRLTCRDINSKTFDYFGKEYFTRKQFMISPFSLKVSVYSLLSV